MTLKSTENTVSNQFQPKGRVKVVKGASILYPQDGGLHFILNIANTAGKTESPLYPLLDRKWKQVKSEVRGSYTNKTGKYVLGSIASNTAVQSDIWVISMLCQDDKLQTDAVALEKCLKEICKMAKYEKAGIHVSTLLTEAIPELTELLNTQLVNQGVSVSFYEEPAN